MELPDRRKWGEPADKGDWLLAMLFFWTAVVVGAIFLVGR